MASKSYFEKLKDPRWQKKRLEILERDNWACTGCGNKDATLNVHHIKYDKNPWDTKDEYLVTLCESCHEFVTDANDKVSYLISEAVNDGSGVSIKDVMVGIISFINVYVNCDQPWGVDIEQVRTVMDCCIRASKNNGYWESIHSKNGSTKNAEE